MQYQPMNDLERNRLLRIENQTQALAHQLILTNQAIIQLQELHGYLEPEKQATLSRIRALETINLKRT